jgi:hypothetical protein
LVIGLLHRSSPMRKLGVSFGQQEPQADAWG